MIRRAFRHTPFRTASFCLAIILINWACSSTHIVDTARGGEDMNSWDIDRFNNEIREQSVDVILRNGRTIEAEHLVLAKDSSNFEEVTDRTKVTIPTKTILQVRYNDIMIGAVRGVFWGVLLGGVSTVAFRPNIEDVGGASHQMPPGLSFMIGGAIGLLAGLAAGDESRYDILTDSTANSGIIIHDSRASTAHNKRQHDARY